jgi:hypothetical protein
MTTPDPPRRSRAQWLADLDAEIEGRRRAMLEAAGGDPLTSLLLRLDEMGREAARGPRLPPADTRGKRAGNRRDRDLVSRARVRPPRLGIIISGIPRLIAFEPSLSVSSYD